MSKVMLLFPPEWVPTAPYLALPTLTAVLRQNGVEVVQKDVNVEAFDHYFSKEFLEFTQLRIEDRLKELKFKERVEELSEEDRNLKDMLYNYTFIDLKHHIKKVTRAKEIIRSQEFYDVDKAEWALNAFREVMEYVSVSYFPASINFYPVESNLNIYRPWVSDDLLKAPRDENVNIYIHLCQQLVFPDVNNEKPDLIGISIGTPVQLMSGMTFAQLLKKQFADIHITVGGNIVTRLKKEFAEKKEFFDQCFDSFICYEGEHALVELVEALDGKRTMQDVANLTWRDEVGQIHVNTKLHTEKVSEAPIPDFDGFPLDKYFVTPLGMARSDIRLAQRSELLS